MHECLINVITVTYNDLDGLVATHASLIAQSNKSFRWVVVDGESSDGTNEFINDVIQKDNSFEIEYIREPDQGIYDAMNKGISRSQPGSFMCFMNAGDCFADNCVLEKISKEINRNGSLMLIYGDSLRVSKKLGKQYLKKSKSLLHLNRGMFCEHQAVFFRKQEGVHYDTRYSLSSDYDFIFRVVKGAEPGQIQKMDMTICVFSHGGAPYQRRKEAILEDALIRYRNGEPFINVFLLLVVHVIWHGIKLRLSSLR